MDSITHVVSDKGRPGAHHDETKANVYFIGGSSLELTGMRAVLLLMELGRIAVDQKTAEEEAGDRKLKERQQASRSPEEKSLD